MSPWIVYSLVLFFLLGMLVMIVIIMQEPKQENQDATGSAATSFKTKASYGMLAAFFALVVVLTVFTQKK